MLTVSCDRKQGIGPEALHGGSVEGATNYAFLDGGGQLVGAVYRGLRLHAVATYDHAWDSRGVNQGICAEF